LTLWTAQRYSAGMQARILIPLVIVIILTLVGVSRAEYDAASVQAAKPKATPATAFDTGIEAKRTCPKSYPFPGGVPVVNLLKLGGHVYTVNLGDYAPPQVKNPSNIPRARR
jgi:hypothetical protein